LLTVPWPASWLVAAFLAAIEAAIWAGAVGELSNQPTMSAAVSAVFVFVFDAVVLFGLARLTDLITAVHAARGELAEAAVTEERVRAADSLRAAVGGGAAGDRWGTRRWPASKSRRRRSPPAGHSARCGRWPPGTGTCHGRRPPSPIRGTAGDSSRRPSAGARGPCEPCRSGCGLVRLRPPGHIRAGLDDRSPARFGLAVGAANRQVMARFLLGSAPGPLVEQLA
jgi:hypothetical protein